MTRALFIADGSSDLPLAGHLETLCRRHGAEIDVASVPADRLGDSTVAGRLRILMREDPDFDLLFVHRDAETRTPNPRYQEVAQAVLAEGFGGPAVAVVPIRMTEAWLLLDEDSIRRVAGKPLGRTPLDLPKLSEVERIADPKTVLREALATASESSGRRLRMLRRDFPTQRRLLLERLDPTGPVSQLAAWKKLEADVKTAVAKL